MCGRGFAFVCTYFNIHILVVRGGWKKYERGFVRLHVLEYLEESSNCESACGKRGSGKVWAWVCVCTCTCCKQ